jgi:hypothetical protein
MGNSRYCPPPTPPHIRMEGMSKVPEYLHVDSLHRDRVSNSVPTEYILQQLPLQQALLSYDICVTAVNVFVCQRE